MPSSSEVDRNFLKSTAHEFGRSAASPVDASGASPHFTVDRATFRLFQAGPLASGSRLCKKEPTRQRKHFSNSSTDISFPARVTMAMLSSAHRWTEAVTESL